MFNLSDKELDRLSREAAEKYEVEKDLGSWNNLEQLLDKELGRSSPVPRTIKPGNPFIYFPALAILIGSFYFILKPSSNTANSTLKNYSSVNKKISDSPQTHAAADSADNAINNKTSANVNKVAKNNIIDNNKIINDDKNINKNNVGEKAKNIASINNVKSSSAENIIKEKNAGINHSYSLINNKRENNIFLKKIDKEKNTAHTNADKSFINDENNAQINAGPSADKNGINKNHSSNKNNKNAGKINKEENDINNIADNNLVRNDQQKLINKSTVSTDDHLKFAIPGNIELQNHNISVHDSLLNKLSVTETGLTDPTKNKNGKKYYTNRSLQIGFLLSPDFSEVKYNYVNKIGSNVGLTLGYQLTSKFSINSGLIFTKKNYTVNGEDFHAPPGFWTNMVHLDFVKATSNMIEVPLNIRYDFNKDFNTTFFVNGGFSSYFIKKENYTYYFHNNNYGRFLQNTVYSTKNNYWFSALNLSTGFETKISNSFSLQVEPYMKLPLTGIGFGKVNLSSYGINLSVKFAPLLSKKRR